MQSHVFLSLSALVAAVVLLQFCCCGAVSAVATDGTCAKIANVMHVAALKLQERIKKDRASRGDKGPKEEAVPQPYLPSSPLATVVNAAVAHVRADSATKTVAQLENTPCDLSCETQLCACLGLNFDSSAATAPIASHSLVGFCSSGNAAALAKAADLANGGDDSLRAKLSDCFASFKSCRETFMASPPEPQEGMSACTRAIVSQGYYVAPESCALTACSFAANLDHLVQSQLPPALLNSAANNNNKQQIDAQKLFSLMNTIDLSVACGADETKVLSQLSMYAHQAANNAAANGGAGGGGQDSIEDRVARELENVTSAPTTARATTENPLSFLINSVIASVITSIADSIIVSSKNAMPTTPRPTPAPVPTTPAPTAKPVTTTPEPTPAPPIKDDKTLLKPGEVQFVAADPVKVSSDVTDFIRTQQKFLAAGLPANFDIKFELFNVGTTSDQFEIKFTVVDSNGDKAAERRIEAAAAQMLSDAMSSKYVVNPALSKLKSPKGRSKRASGPPYPTLPAPLNPPPPKMEELPVAAVVGGIIGGIIIGLVGGGAVAHFFCSKVETLPLADRILPTADDDDDSDEEEEEDEDGEDATADAVAVGGGDTEMTSVGRSGSSRTGGAGGGGGGGSSRNNYKNRDGDEGEIMSDVLGVGVRNKNNDNNNNNSAARRSGGSGPARDTFSPRERDGLGASPSSASRDPRGQHSGSRRTGGGDRRPASSSGAERKDHHDSGSPRRN